MRFRTAAEWAGTILFGVIAATVWIYLAPTPIGRAVVAQFKPPQPVERPAKIEAFVVKLKAAPLLAGLDTNPTSCFRHRKGRRDLCSYRADDTGVLVSWSRKSGRLAGVSISKTEPPGSTPFAWAGLADMVSRLCGGVDVAQADALVRSIPDSLAQTAWLDRGEPVAPGRDEGSRSILLEPHGACILSFSETRMAGAIKATLELERFGRRRGRPGAGSPQ